MKKTAIITILTVAILQAYAQKLPQVQQVSLRAPANARADGKPTEWVKFQAYNTACEVYYTIANDDKKLYVVFQSKNQDLLPRLVNGGITFLIQRSGKKSDNGTVGAKFPYMPDKDQRVPFGWNTDGGKGDDGYVTAISNRMSAKIKWIYTKGLLAKDGPIPIYNDEGVQAGARLDSKGVYTCEISFDLGVLGLSVNSNSKFAYHIIINGEPNKYAENIGKLHYVKTDNSPVTEAQIQAAIQTIENKSAARSATPDFWGEYTLAKNQ